MRQHTGVRALVLAALFHLVALYPAAAQKWGPRPVEIVSDGAGR